MVFEQTRDQSRRSGLYGMVLGLVVFGLVAVGLVAVGLLAFGLVAFGLFEVGLFDPSLRRVWAPHLQFPCRSVYKISSSDQFGFHIFRKT